MESDWIFIGPCFEENSSPEKGESAPAPPRGVLSTSAGALFSAALDSTRCCAGALPAAGGPSPLADGSLADELVPDTAGGGSVAVSDAAVVLDAPVAAPPSAVAGTAGADAPAVPATDAAAAGRAPACAGALPAVPATGTVDDAGAAGANAPAAPASAGCARATALPASARAAANAAALALAAITPALWLRAFARSHSAAPAQPRITRTPLRNLTLNTFFPWNDLRAHLLEQLEDFGLGMPCQTYSGHHQTLAFHLDRPGRIELVAVGIEDRLIGLQHIVAIMHVQPSAELRAPDMVPVELQKGMRRDQLNRLAILRLHRKFSALELDTGLVGQVACLPGLQHPLTLVAFHLSPMKVARVEQRARHDSRAARDQLGGRTITHHPNGDHQNHSERRASKDGERLGDTPWTHQHPPTM